MKKITLLFFMSLLSWCSYAQLPLETFESNGNNLPVGWQRINVAGLSQQWVVATHNAIQTPAYGGTGHVAYMQKENVLTGTAEDWLITPQFMAPTNGQLRFQSRLTQVGDDGNTYRLMIHVGNTPLNTAAYTEIVPAMGELQINPDPYQTDYLEKVFNLPASAFGQQVYIAFVMNGDNGDRWLVDNVMVVEQCLDPTALSVTSVGLNTATLNWTNPGTATQWYVDIVGALEAPTGVGTLYSGAPPYTATTDSSGDPLEENTDYKFYVKAKCSDDVTSNWVGPIYFSTVALGESCTAPITIGALPFSDTDTTGNYADNINGSPGSSGCGSTNGYLNGNDVFYSYTATANGVISIDVTGNSAYSGIFVYTSCANVGVSCAGGAVAGFTATPLSIPTFSVTAGQTYYFVISTWADPQVTPYTLTIQQVNCAPPVGLPTTGIGQTSAQLSWTNPSSATSWQVVVQDPGDGIPSGAGLTVNTNTNYVATAEYDGTALVAATPYEYYVRANCGNGTFSAWAGPYLFNTTICEASAQCSYTFIMTDAYGDGWNGGNMTVSQNGIPIATIGATMTGLGPVSVTVPVCDNIPLTLFWTTAGDYPGEMGVSIQNNFGQIIYNKPSGTGSAGTQLYSGLVDCDTPACLPPTGLAVTNISTDSVTLGWNGPATGDWDYYVVTAGSPAPTSSTPGVNTTTNPVNVTTGLVAGTNYEYYVRVVCDATTNSTWAGPFPFTTAVCPLAEQCLYTFVMTDLYDGWNGNTMTITQNGATIATIGSTFTWEDGTGPETVTVALCHDQPFELFWNAGGNYPNEIGVSIVNSFSQTIYTKPPGTGSSNTLLYSGVVDCLNPACLAPTGLTASDMTVDSAMLSWDGPATGNWEVFVVPTGDPAPTATSTGLTATTNPFEVALPTPATNYDYYVRVICDATNSSDWAGPFEFHSMVCEPAGQCNYVFELIDQYGDGWNGGYMTVVQAGVPVAVLGEDFTFGTGPIEVQVPLCPGEEFELVWSDSGGYPGEMGITIYTPFAEDIYVKEPGEGVPGTTLYTGNGDCTPPPCPKPQDLFVDALGLDTADLHWTEMGSATNWEVYVVPYNSPAPLPTDAGTATTAMPYTATETVTGDDFTSGTTYDYYVRAICGGDDGNSNWSGPITFTTLIENDDCEGAIVVGVNPGLDCDVFAPGTITGATGSTQTQSCVTWMDIEYDVWYSFVATATTHAVNINNQVGAYFESVIYEGDNCGALTELACGDDSETISGLTVGNTYYVRVYTTYLDDPTDLTSFELCVNTPPPPILVSQDEYTVEQLVQDVLIGSDCAQITNIQSSTGIDNGFAANGIGYFNQNQSSFPMEEGIVLVSGEAMNAAGPNDFPAGWANDWPGWPGDSDLEDITGLGTGQSNDATWVSFDFVTLTDELNFNFLFASEEYDQATFECTYSDSFAFILTDNEDASAPPINLAVLPSTTIPIQVTNIHPDNGFCPAVNEGYFGQYNNTPFDPINFNGNTVILTATSPVLPNHSYNIKLVIANALDHSHNSAVFLEAGSFDIGQPHLGEPFLEADGNAICSGGSVLLDTHLDNPEDFEFVWYENDNLIEGADGPTLLVTEEGEYKVVTTYIGAASTCSETGTIVVEFYDPVEDITNDPVNLTACNASGFDTFDLTQNTTTILNGVPNTEDYTLTYYLTQEDAELGDTAIAITNPEAYQNATQFEQTIFVRIDVAISPLVTCHGVKSFTISVEDNTPEFTITEDFSICAGSTGTITVTGTNYDDADVTFTWTQGGVPFAGTTNSISVTESGDYEVTIDNNGCTATGAVTVTVTPVPEADAPENVTSCDSYMLPELSAGNNYYTGVDGTGTMLSAGEVITSTQEIHIFAQSGTTPNCTDDNVFTVTIVPTPVITTPGDQASCDSYTLPELAVGNYFTEAGGAGTMLSAGEAITSSQTVYVYAQSSTTPNCTAESSFVVTITPTPVADAPGDVAVCDSYVLPSLGVGNYYTGSGGTGTMLNAGSTVSETQTLYVYAQSGTSPNCTDENSFTVTIIPTPIIAITEGCSEDNVYVLEAIFTDEIYNPDNVTFAWTDASGASLGSESSIVVAGPGMYYVTVTPDGEATCPIDGQINVIDTTCDVQRGISPNGDDKNQSFDLTALDVRKLSIFNRYGTEVYSFNGSYTNQWEGQSSGGDELPTGTYFYMIERANGESRTGWVYINRAN